MNPCPVIWEDNPSLRLILPYTTTINWINPTKAHYQGVYPPQSLYYGSSEGSSFFPFHISYYSSPYHITCPLLPSCPPAPSTSLFYKGVHCNCDRYRTDVDPRVAQPLPSPVSTVAVSLQENLISKDNVSHDTPLRCLKLSAMFFLSLVSFYSGVSNISSFISYQR